MRALDPEEPLAAWAYGLSAFVLFVLPRLGVPVGILSPVFDTTLVVLIYALCSEKTVDLWMRVVPPR